MGHTKITITIPEDVYGDAKAYISKHNLELNHLVSEALKEKLRRAEEAAYISKINEVFADPEVDSEQRRTAEAIADATDLHELPW
jgi:hypothetical protein